MSTVGNGGITDPTNGFTAIHCSVLRELPLDKIATRYFFETDMLFRLNTLRAVVRDIPMDSVYEDEESNLSVKTVLPEFLKSNVSRMFRRYGYNYWLRDFNIASIYSVLGTILVGTGSIFGLSHWMQSTQTGEFSSSGTVMLAALPIILGAQFLIAFLQYDMSRIPSEPIAPQLPNSTDDKH